LFYLLFIFYLIVFCWLITRIKFFTESSLPTRILIGLFLLRIIASLVGGYFNLYYSHFPDPLFFHKEGIAEYHLLFTNPKEYFINIFQDSRGNDYSRFLDTSNSFWNDTKSNLIIKLLSIFDIFSGKNFFINSLFYNFVVFFGVVALYKVFIKIFPYSSYQLIACIFIFPSALFFTSMIHRDGLTLLSLAMVVYHLFFLLNDHFSIKRLLYILFFLLMILLLRNFVFIALVPALIAWIIAQYKRKHAFVSFLSIYVIIAILFFCSGYISEKTNLPKYVSERQLAFVEIAKEGASTITINPLYPNFASFLKNMPQAFNHALMRPYISEIKSALYIPVVLEILLFEILFILFLFYRKKNISFHPFLYFCLFFGLTMFLIIGYTVPIIGAIVRYRSIYFIFLMVPMVCYTNWAKIMSLISIKFKKM